MSAVPPPPGAIRVYIDTEDICGICHEKLTEPCVYPCGHIACRECLASWALMTTPETFGRATKHSSCPTCRKVVVEINPNVNRVPATVPRLAEVTSPGLDRALGAQIMDVAKMIFHRQGRYFDDRDIYRPQLTKNRAQACIEWLTSPRGRLEHSTNLTITFNSRMAYEDISSIAVMMLEFASTGVPSLRPGRRDRLKWLTITQIAREAIGSFTDWHAGSERDMLEPLRLFIITRCELEKIKNFPGTETFSDTPARDPFFLPGSVTNPFGIMFFDMISFVTHRQMVYRLEEATNNVYEGDEP